MAAFSNRALCSAAGVSTEEVPSNLSRTATLHRGCLSDSRSCLNVVSVLGTPVVQKPVLPLKSSHRDSMNKLPKCHTDTDAEKGPSIWGTYF